MLRGSVQGGIEVCVEGRERGKAGWVWVAVDKRTDLLGFPAVGCFGDWNKMAKSVIKEIPLIP